MAADSLGAVTAIGLAMGLQGLSPAAAFQPLWQVPFLVALTVVSGAAFGLYSAVIRYIALKAAFRIALAVSVVVALLLGLQSVIAAPLFQPGFLFNFGILLVLALGALRVLARHFLGQASDPDADRLLIYGAGEAGVQVANALEADRRRRVIGFVDDRQDVRRNEVAGLPVYGSADLPALVDRQGLASILLALPSISRRRKQEIVAHLEPLPVTVKTVPALQEILSGQAQISEIRDIDIEDLLGRDPVPPDEALLSKSIAGQVVMVTGAGGSIGSELCRQIIPSRPAHLVLFEANECSLFHIQRELEDMADSDVHITAVLGNVLDRSLVETCVQRFRVQTLFHAAAYKHVPLVEHNVRAGLRNNVFGTWNVAEAALNNGVHRFILVSTDKAVRPTNVMGSTKRVAELVVQAMALRAGKMNGSGPDCIFSMVRFGNVLGSSGSVVPHFRDQIQAGGPVTVTHPDITRFFMTIPEAAQLVIQAGAMAKGGEVFVLDMGQSIRILDLARRMIRLAGYTVRDEENPEGDIEIAFSGLRPGEKLYEELLIGESTISTDHPKIGCAQESLLDWATLESLLQRMYRAVNEYDAPLVKDLLKETVCEYVAADENYDTISATEAEPQSKVSAVPRSA